MGNALLLKGEAGHAWRVKSPPFFHKKTVFERTLLVSKRTRNQYNTFTAKKGAKTVQKPFLCALFQLMPLAPYPIGPLLFDSKMAVKQSLGDSTFLLRTLEKIYNDKETKRSQHAKLRKACEDALSK